MIFWCFQGNGHLIYKNVFYYHEKGKPSIIRYNLTNRTLDRCDLPKANVNNSLNLLYKIKHKYVDLSMDENGLWAIYSLDGNTAVVRINTGNRFEVQGGWNISVRNQDVGEMFIVCGILYAVDSVTEFKTKIRYTIISCFIFFFPLTWRHRLNLKIHDQRSLGVMSISLFNRLIKINLF